jgi:hypothetical protein
MVIVSLSMLIQSQTGKELPLKPRGPGNSSLAERRLELTKRKDCKTPHRCGIPACARKRKRTGYYLGTGIAGT